MLIVTGAVALVTVGWSFLNHRRAPLRSDGPSGTITPGKVSAALITLIAIVIIGAGVFLVLRGELGMGLGCTVVGTALALFMGPSLTHMHDLAWNDFGVEGPSRLFGLGLGLGRTHIRWQEIGAVGSTITSYWFIQATDGRRIYWSYLYPGYSSFNARLRAKRPDLTVSLN